jgi:hypothetical protein
VISYGQKITKEAIITKEANQSLTIDRVFPTAVPAHAVKRRRANLVSSRVFQMSAAPARICPHKQQHAHTDTPESSIVIDSRHGTLNGKLLLLVDLGRRRKNFTARTKNKTKKRHDSKFAV